MCRITVGKQLILCPIGRKPFLRAFTHAQVAKIDEQWGFLFVLCWKS